MFRELLQLHAESPRQAQECSAAHFSDAVRRSPFQLLDANGVLPQRGEVLVVGVAPAYKKYDLELLDELMVTPLCGRYVTYVFDCNVPEARGMIQRCFPGLGEWHQTPIVSHWREGDEVESLWGFDAKQYLRVLATEKGG
jgi:hypothetical protein